MNLAARVNEAYEQLDKLRNPAGMAGLLHPKAAKPVTDAIDVLFTSIAELRVVIQSALNPPTEWKYLDHKEATASLAAALTAIAKEHKRLRAPADSVLTLVQAVVEPEHRAFWSGTSQDGYLSGLIRGDERLKALLKAAGVLAWTNHFDNQIRLVDSRWLSTPAEILEHVESTKVIGRRCRFCTLEEPDTSPELQPVDPDKRKGFDMQNDRYVLNVHTVNTHEACRPFWEEWLDIATKERKARG